MSADEGGPGRDLHITGDDVDLLAASPQLEGFKARGVEVLLLTDPVDEFWMSVGRQVQGKEVQVGHPRRRRPRQDRGAREREGEAETKTKPPEKLASLIAVFKLTLGDAVKDVRISERLTDSPVCLVADEGDMDMHLERLLKQHRQLDTAAKRILEVNPSHPLIRRLTDLAPRTVSAPVWKTSHGSCSIRPASWKANRSPIPPPSPGVWR